MKNDTKQRFIKTAAELFSVEGYQMVGVSEILKVSGAPKGSLYYHFPGGKEELGVEAVRYTCQDICTDLKNEFAEKQTGIQTIIGIIERAAKRIDDSERLRGMSLSLIALETYRTSERLRLECDASFHAIFAMYQRLLEKDGLSGELAKQAAVTILSMIEGALTLSLTQKSSQPLRAIAGILPGFMEQLKNS